MSFFSRSAAESFSSECQISSAGRATAAADGVGAPHSSAPSKDSSLAIFFMRSSDRLSLKTYCIFAFVLKRLREEMGFQQIAEKRFGKLRGPHASTSQQNGKSPMCSSDGSALRLSVCLERPNPPPVSCH